MRRIFVLHPTRLPPAGLVEEGEVLVAELEVFPLVEGAAEKVAGEVDLKQAHARLLGQGHVPAGQGHVRQQAEVGLLAEPADPFNVRNGVACWSIKMIEIIIMSKKCNATSSVGHLS